MKDRFIDTDFGPVTGTLRVAEKHILTTAQIERLLDTPDRDEVLKLLTQSSEYDFSALSHPDDYDTVLHAERKRVFDMMAKLCPDWRIVEVLRAKFDFHNIKIAVKAHYTGVDSAHLYVRVTPHVPEVVAEQIFQQWPKDIPAHIAQAGAAAIATYEETKDPQRIDLEVDKHMFAYMSAVAADIDNELITEYIASSIDFYNVKTLLRVRHMGKDMKFLTGALVTGGLTDITDFTSCYDRPWEAIGEFFSYKYFNAIMRQVMENYEKSGNFSLLEKLTDNYLLNLVKRAKYIAYGAETVFAYLVAKENELRQVRLLITCKANYVSTDTLKERLRDNYA